MDKEKMIEFTGEQCKIFPEDSEMGEYLRETMKMLQEEPCEDAPDTNVGSKADGMTKEPTAYRRYRDLLEYFGNDSILEDDEEFKKWLKRIKWHVKKADELYRKYECQKELCEDAVSRKKIEKLKRWRFPYDTNTTIPKSDLFVKLTDIRALPPVKPAHKKGKWIDTTEISTNKRGQIVHEVICSECNGISYFRGMDGKYIGANFCPNCGAKMASG